MWHDYSHNCRNYLLKIGKTIVSYHVKIGIQSHLNLFKEKKNMEGEMLPPPPGQGDLNATILPPCDVTVTN